MGKENKHQIRLFTPPTPHVNMQHMYVNIRTYVHVLHHMYSHVNVHAPHVRKCTYTYSHVNVYYICMYCTCTYSYMVHSLHVDSHVEYMSHAWDSHVACMGLTCRMHVTHMLHAHEAHILHAWRLTFSQEVLEVPSCLTLWVLQEGVAM